MGKTIERTCDAESRAAPRARKAARIGLPILGSKPNVVRPSRTSKWRAGVLILLHLMILAHVVHWLIAGKTVSPVEPSEAMYTLNKGYLNAGFFLFAAAIGATALFGRFFCGWGCHLVAYQDLCAWMMKKLGVKPKPFRSRLLVLAPLALAIYMFVWPSAYRAWLGGRAPAMVNNLLETDFWKTFPNVVMAILTFAVCGFAIVYFLGAKGFCTYGCPYGGFFGLVDPLAAGRIRVTDACEHCGHCTAVCTSNVKVHEEVALFGMVVDPGCMKCMDCVSVCPNDALYWGFGRPAVGAKPSSSRKPVPYDFTLAEEAVMAAVGLGLLFAYRGLYGRIPLLLAMGMAAIGAYLILKLYRLLGDANVRLQNLQLKRGGRLTRSGTVFVGAMLLILLLTLHSAAVQYLGWRGQTLFASLNVDSAPRPHGQTWWNAATAVQREQLNSVIVHLERADRWGLLSTDVLLDSLVLMHLARDDVVSAERTARRMAALYPRNEYAHSRLAGVLLRAGRSTEAEAVYRDAIRINPACSAARGGLAGLLVDVGRAEDAAHVFEQHILLPRDAGWALEFGQELVRSGHFALARGALQRLLEIAPNHASAHHWLGVAVEQLGQDGLPHLQRAVELDPNLAEGYYDLGYALLIRDRIAQAIPPLQQAVALKPDFAVAQYNLGVATAMQGRLREAVPYIRQAIQADPNDPMYQAFLSQLLTALGDPTGAEEAAQQARQLQQTGGPPPFEAGKW